MKRLSIIILLILNLYSCKTNEKGDDFVNIETYFSGEIGDVWVAGLDLMMGNPKKEYLPLLYTLYFDKKFKVIRTKVLEVLYEYFNIFNIEFTEFVSVVDSVDKVDLAIDLVSGLEKYDITSFSNSVYLSPTSEIKNTLIQEIGGSLLDYSIVLDLYSTDNRDIKSGVLLSAGYIHNEDVRNWLVEKLYDEDDIVSSGAVFSLSKHGSVGFSLLAQNMVNLSNRLILISIDLLTFNKVVEAYQYFPILLVEPNDLIASSVLKSYDGLDKNSIYHIIDALKICHPDLRLPLLKLLEKFDGKEYMTKISFLLEYSQTRFYIIDLYFRNAAKILIRNILAEDKYGVSQFIIDYAIEKSSGLLFEDILLSQYTLKYFLSNLDLETVQTHFNKIGFDNNYLNDYSHLFNINASINIIESFEVLNGEIDYISDYFEMEQSLKLANRESEAFFKGMENWIETQNDEFLEQSISIKKNTHSSDVVVDYENFLNTLNDSELQSILSYEKAKKDVILNYRKLTYRLKQFGFTFIENSSYSHLLD